MLDIQTVDTSYTGMALMGLHLEGLLGVDLFGAGLVKVGKEVPIEGKRTGLECHRYICLLDG